MRFKIYAPAMHSVQSPAKGPARIFGTTTFSFAAHLFGTLTCATCWTIFGPALALLFGSGGAAFLASLRPAAPLALGLSAVGLGFSFYQLAKARGTYEKLPFRLAAAFTIASAVGWFGSVWYTTATLLKG